MRPFCHPAPSRSENPSQVRQHQANNTPKHEAGREAMSALLEKTPPDDLSGEHERTASHTDVLRWLNGQQLVRARPHDETSC